MIRLGISGTVGFSAGITGCVSGICKRAGFCKVTGGVNELSVIKLF